MTTRAFQLRAVIKGTRPPVWRRILVADDTTLSELHAVLQAAFGWGDAHLHEFDIGGRSYGSVSDPDDIDDGLGDEGANRLRDLATVGSSFVYVYDFGDSWEHHVAVEKVLPADATVVYPACVDGRRACPPEDCGGAWGYEELLKVLDDPDHEEHESMLEWVGGTFDPDAFDPADFQARLALVRTAAG